MELLLHFAIIILNLAVHTQWRRKMFLSRGAESKQVKTRFTRT